MSLFGIKYLQVVCEVKKRNLTDVDTIPFADLHLVYESFYLNISQLGMGTNVWYASRT